MVVSTKRKGLENVCFDFYGLFYKGQQSPKEAMAKVLNGLLLSFTNAMNEELVEPFTIIDFSFSKQLRAWQIARHHGMIACPLIFFKKS